MNIWLVMLLGGAITFGLRMSFIYLFGRFDVPETMRRALRYVPPAVLSALIAPALFIPDGKFDIGFDNHYLLAGLVAIVVGWRTKNTLVTLLAGTVALVVLQAVG